MMLLEDSEGKTMLQIFGHPGEEPAALLQQQPRNQQDDLSKKHKNNYGLKKPVTCTSII